MNASFFQFLDKKHSIAKPEFNRWFVPPAALCIHLCIGMAYGFSVFWLPLSKMADKDCKDIGFFRELFAADCNWNISTLGWIYTLFFVLLGSSAAVWGGWLEKVGPRKASFVAAMCWGGGMLISSAGIYLHQLWIIILGSGLIGGIGLGLGYISPVSTLIKWFPDRRGMATGMAIMGFGGGAMIGSPLAQKCMEYFSVDGKPGIAQTFIFMGTLYLVYMLIGCFIYRIPPGSWTPKNWTPKARAKMITDRHVHSKKVWGIPQFWLLWIVLCMNVSAGIGVIGMASPMLQEVFGGALVGIDKKFSELDAMNDKMDLEKIADIAAGFTALISLFNIGGRFVWASLSDKIGRKWTYNVFFLLGIALYAAIPFFSKSLNIPLFIASICIIISMYGGGFSTIPAYLADLFGSKMVGAIHGRLLTAWATAGILGPVVVNYMRDYQLSLGIPKEQVYNQTMYILCALLLIGFICNLCVRPVASKYFMTDEDAKELDANIEHASARGGEQGVHMAEKRTNSFLIAFVWIIVVVPLLWGVYRTVSTVAGLFL